MKSIGTRVIAIGFVATWALAAPALAQNDKMTPVPTPAQPHAIELGTGPLPGATAQESWHRQYGSLFARNVTVATLTPYLPDPSNASGAAVVVAPGGGFRTLSMENEGSNVAKALAAKGVAKSWIAAKRPAELHLFEQGGMDSACIRRRRPAPAGSMSSCAGSACTACSSRRTEISGLGL